jgi:predicted dienelactone hydrolase
MPKTHLSRRIFQGVGIMAALGIVAVGVLLVSLRLEHTIDVTLPAPTGPFTVGRAMYAWVDDTSTRAQQDTLAPDPAAKRELLAWIWYPAAGPSAPTDDYLPPAWRAEIVRDRGTLLSNFLTRDLAKVHGHSARNPDVSPQQPSYPVVILRGGASAEVANYTTLAEDLASHGYVVVGFDAPYRTLEVVFPDGRVMRRLPANNPELCAEQPQAQQGSCMSKLLAAWTADIGFALDQLQRMNADASGKFTGRLDMTRVGVFGHSFGGAQAAQFCHDDARCKAGIDLDGQPFGSVVQEGIPHPFLFVLSDQANTSDPVSRQILANIQSIYDRLPRDGRLRIAIRGAYHFGFSDDGALLKSHIILGTLRKLGILGIDGRRQLEVTSFCVRTFFDAYLKGLGGAPLKLASPAYPEIQVIE